MSFDEGLDVLRRDQAYMMTERCELPSELVGTRTGLNANQT